MPPNEIAPEGITLRPWLPGVTTIGATQDLVLRGDGYPFQAAAHEAAGCWRAVLQVAFAAAQIGADFGRRVLDDSSSSELERLSTQTGQRLIRDRLGPIVFATEPRPIFQGMSATSMAGRFENHVLDALLVAAAQRVEADEKNRLAYDLFGASFSVDEPDARLMLLMMAVETLIDPKPRAGVVVAHIQGLIAITTEADIPPREKQSITQSLRWLLRQSIGQAGRDLAATLGHRRYLDKSATKFFTDCYRVRSALAHGSPDRPHPTEVDRYAAHLEVLVSDLLARPLLDRLPRFELEGPGRAAWDAAVRAARDAAPEQTPGRGP